MFAKLACVVCATLARCSDVRAISRQHQRTTHINFYRLSASPSVSSCGEATLSYYLALGHEWVALLSMAVHEYGVNSSYHMASSLTAVTTGIHIVHRHAH